MEQLLPLLTMTAPVIGLVIAAFVATNIDNLTLLVSWIATERRSIGRIFAGYCIGMAGLLVAAALLNLLSAVLPVEYLGYLGIVPIVIGIKALHALRTQDHSTVNVVTSTSIMAIASTQMANGVDTVLTFSPLMAESGTQVDAVIAIVFSITAIGWFGVAWLLGNQASKVAVVARYGQWIAPIIMICVGLYIVDNTATDLLAGSD